MKKKIWIYLMLIFTSILAMFFLANSYQSNTNDKRNNLIRENYLTHTDILVSYTDRINEKEDGILDELNENISKATDPLYIGTYTNALSYYYLRQNDYETHTDLANKSIEIYEKSTVAAPIILNTYNYMISNSLAKKDYSAALKYSYASMEKLDEMDYSFISESFTNNLEIMLNCNLINIFVNNNFSSKATKYYDAIKDLNEDDPLYLKNEKTIVFAKLIYTDSVEDYTEALKLSIKYHELTIKANSPNIEGMRINIATSLLNNKMPDEALPHILAAEKHYSDSNQKIVFGNIYGAYGEYYFQKGNYTEAYKNFSDSYNSYKLDSNYIMDQVYILEKLLKTNMDGNLNNDITSYLRDYIDLNENALDEEGIANLFITMDEINSKSYESKLILQEKDKEALKSAAKLKNRLVLHLLIVLVLFVLLTFVLFNEIKTRKSYGKKLQDLVDTDFLTGCYSRTYGIRIINNLIKNSNPFTVAILDIDNFKNINDTYGHPVGDEALKLLGEFLITKSKDIGIAIRYGGEEFIIIFNDKGIEESFALLDSLRVEFSNLTFADSVSCTISIGAKVWTGESFEDLINETDKLLYEAKHSGKNKVCI
ncbi:MAG: tetratricopeptide repeat-containing diguanylate cyclase [Clostridium sp.]